MRWSEQLAQGEQFLEDLRVSWRIMIMLSLLHVSVVFFCHLGETHGPTSELSSAKGNNEGP